MNKFTTANISALACLILVLFVAGVVYGATTRSGSMIAGRFDYVEVANVGSSEPVCISAGGEWEYVDMPDMTKTFTQGGFLPDEVMVTFSGQFEGGSPVSVRVLIDGVVQPGLGSGVLVHPAFMPASLVALHFVSAPISGGAHVATLQWASDNPNACPMLNHSMIIQHR